MNQLNENSQFVGNWNEEGLLNSFKKKGITYFSSVSEYLANSIDSGANKIKLCLINNEFIVIDNGSGMNNHKIKNMFSNYHSNHENDKSIGTVGIGAKLGNAFLSKYRHTSCIFTKAREGDYYKVTIPWGEIYDEKVYQDKIQVEIMTETEKEYFQRIQLKLQKRNSNKTFSQAVINSLTGTIITHVFDPQTDRDFYDMLCQQFDKEQLKLEFSEKKKRWDCMFHKPELQICFCDKIHNHYPHEELVLYDHMNPNLTYYFNDLQYYEVRVLSDSQDNYIFVVEFEGQDYIIPTSGRGYSKHPAKFIHLKYKEFKDTHDRISYQVGAEINVDYFDPNNPLKVIDYKTVDKLMAKKDISISGYEPEDLAQVFDKTEMIKIYNKYLSSALMTPYDRNFFCDTKDQKIDCCKTSIIRNGQQISSINLPDFRYSQQDGGCGTEEKTLGVVITSDLISYHTISKQNNVLDDVFGVQEIKDHIEENKIRVDLLRLLSFLRNEYTKNTFQGILDIRNNALKELYPSEEDNGENSEEELSDEEIRERKRNQKISKFSSKLKKIQTDMITQNLLDEELSLIFQDLINYLD